MMVIVITHQPEKFSRVHENGQKNDFQKSMLELFNKLHIFFQTPRNYLYTKTNFVFHPKVFCRGFLDSNYDPFDDIDDILITLVSLFVELLGAKGKLQTA